MRKMRKMRITILMATIIIIIMLSLNFFSVIIPKMQRNELISSYGWIIDRKSVIIENVKIPLKFSEMLLNYNEIQKKSGYNLEKFKGKTLKKYTYRLKNHEDKFAVINIFEHHKKIVGADIVCPNLSGVLQPINERIYQNAS